MDEKHDGMSLSKSQSRAIEELVSESRRLLKDGESKDLSVLARDTDVMPEIKDVIENLSKAIQEQQLRAQYEIMKYKLAERALHTGVWDMDVIDGDPVNPDNAFTWSDEFRKLLGFTDENDFPNKLNSWSDRIHPEDWQWVMDAFERHLTDTSGKTPYNVQYRIKMKSGEYRYFHDLGDTLRDASGKPLRVAGLFLDIHDEKMQYEEIERARELNELQLTKLNLVVKAANIGLWDMDVVKDDIVNPANPFNWSDQIRKMLGYSNESDFPNLLGSLAGILHPDDAEKVVDHFVKHLLDTTGKTAYNIEYRVLRKNGECGYFRAYGETSRDENGNAIRISGALKDITEEKRVSLELAKQKQEATELAHWYKSILDAIPNPVSVTDADMHWTFANKAVTDFLGAKMDDLLGKHCRAWDSEVCNTPACGIACAKRGVMRTFFSHAGASYLADIGILKKMDGQIAGYIEVVQDITKLKEMEEEALAASKTKSQFLATMSHEMRTPMNAILGIAEIQLRDEKLSPGQKEALDKIYDAGDLLLGIINDILDLSKIEAGKLEILPSEYEVASLISDTATMNMMRIGSKPIEFQLLVDENTPSKLIGDELRIKQILNNILSNAIKYTQHGTVKLEISAEAGEGGEANDASIVFSVSDTGQGMTEEQVSKLFDEYSRFNFEANRATEGTGLGMSITKNLVSMMNGKLSVKSELNKGSIFTFRLPQKCASPGAVGRELAESLQKLRTCDARHSRKQVAFEPIAAGKILIVDDVESNLYVAKGLMTPYGLTIDTALSGFEAIGKIQSGNVYDIVFMDHMMPNMDGIEAAARIRALGGVDPASKNMPIVALTANAVVGNKDMFLANGFNDFLSKPIDMEKLDAILKHWMPKDMQIKKQAPSQTNAAPEAPLPEIEGLDFAAGLARIGGSQSKYKEILGVFAADAKANSAMFENVPSKDGLKLFTTIVHGFKSGLANIGANALSEAAAAIEAAGRNGDIASIASNLTAFREELAALAFRISQAIGQGGAGTEAAPTEVVQQALSELKIALDAMDTDGADNALAKLNNMALEPKMATAVSAIAKHTLFGDFKKASEAVDEALGQIG
jgi:PAS domain S-box-containing protein